MYLVIKKVAHAIRSFHSRFVYALKIAVWVVEVLGKLAAILDSFPGPPVPADEKADKNAADDERSDPVSGGDAPGVPREKIQ